MYMSRAVCAHMQRALLSAAVVLVVGWVLVGLVLGSVRCPLLVSRSLFVTLSPFPCAPLSYIHKKPKLYLIWPTRPDPVSLWNSPHHLVCPNFEEFSFWAICIFFKDFFRM